MMNNQQNDTAPAGSREAILLALFENYESIYDVDALTSVYHCYHESEAFHELRIQTSGKDFFADLHENVERAIYPADREFVHKTHEKDTMIKELSSKEEYSVVYRLLISGKPYYHKMRAVLKTIDGRPHILIGIRNIDEAVRSDKASHDQLAAMYQKEKNHMEAILGSAANYLEANLTRDELIKFSSRQPSAEDSVIIALPPNKEHLTYSELNRWLCDNYVLGDVKEYNRVSDRKYLIRCFERGEKRASAYFNVRSANGSARMYRNIFYLYRDDGSKDIFAFCVAYDLTEQLRKEQEVQNLEEELRLSRIRNFTSQMQPHFLYNALGSIQEIVLEDPNYAAKLLGDFTIHLRSCIRAMENDNVIPFTQELENIRAYASIEKMRLGDKLKVQYEIEADGFRILPLTVQPLVENAIRHGVYERGPAGGTVTVRSRERADAWVVEVEDNGVGFDTSVLEKEIASGMRDSTGLKNIQFRLNKVMHASAAIESRVGVGTKVTITIPKGEELDACDPC